MMTRKTKKDLKVNVIEQVLFKDFESFYGVRFQILNGKYDKDSFKEFKICKTEEFGKYDYKEVENENMRYWSSYKDNDNLPLKIYISHYYDNNWTRDSIECKVKFEFKGKLNMYSIEAETVDTNLDNDSYKDSYTWVANNKEDKVEILNNKDYYVYVLFTRSYMPPIIRISDNAIANFYDLYNEKSFFYDSYHFEILVQKINTRKYKLMTVKENLEAIYTESSIAKENIKYNDLNQVVEYYNYANLVSFSHGCTKVNGVEVDSCYIEKKYGSTFIHNFDLINNYYGIIRINPDNIAYCTVYSNHDGTVQEQNPNICANFALIDFELIKSELDSKNVGYAYDLFIIVQNEIYNTGVNIDAPEIVSKQILPEYLNQDYLDSLSRLTFDGTIVSFKFDNDFVLSYHRSTPEIDTSSLRLCDQDSNIIFEYNLHDHFLKERFISISGIQFISSYSPYNQFSGSNFYYIDNDIEYNIDGNIDDMNEYTKTYKLNSFHSYIFQNDEYIYKRNSFGIPVLCGIGVWDDEYLED